MAKRVTTMGAICFSALNNHLSKYILYSFWFFLWKNAGLNHGKVPLPSVVRYFHDIRFPVDHVWTIRGPSFATLKDKSGLKVRRPGPEGYHHWSYMCFCFKLSFK